MDKHQGIKHHCEICKKSFTRKRVYESHMSAHAGQNKFKCETCGVGFNKKLRFEKHVRKHVPEPV